MTRWHKPYTLATSLLPFLNASLLTQRAENKTRVGLSRDDVSDQEVDMASLNAYLALSKGASALSRSYGITVGDFAYVVARVDNLDFWDDNNDIVFVDLCASNIKQDVTDNSAFAWAMAWVEAGQLSNAGFSSFVNRLYKRGLTFDQCQPYISVRIFDSYIIENAVRNDIDVDLLTVIS